MICGGLNRAFPIQAYRSRDREAKDIQFKVEDIEMIADRRRIEREWIEARSEKAKLQSEVTRARRAAKTDPAAAATQDLLDRYNQAKLRCKRLDREFFSLLELQSRLPPSRSAA